MVYVLSPVTRTASSTTSSGKNTFKEERPILLLRTSGTTAIPKIVPLTARALLYNAQCQIRAMNINRNDCILNAMPFFHIGGLSCSFFTVLVSGSSAILSGPFQPEKFLHEIIGKKGEGEETASIVPTWINAVPTIHTALLLHIMGQKEEFRQEVKTKNCLRFIRSGASPIAPATMDKLAETFGSRVINSYALSECMPVCVQVFDGPRGTVGIPVGPSLRIVNENGSTLPYGVDGEVAIKGTGVIPAYLGIAANVTHTQDGWLRTGDVGRMDRSGELFLSGRSKELIKRGGEQIWPMQVDAIVEELAFVGTCITFGVPNDLWGEEVAAAIVTTPEAPDEGTMKKAIIDTCRKHLDPSAVPSQIVFIDESDLLKGSSGKFLRSKFAEHLGLGQTDVAALNILNKNGIMEHEPVAAQEMNNIIPPKDAHKAALSPALNGVRIIASFFVAMNHIGFFPSLAWSKIQSFNISIPIFFILGAFNLAVTTSGRLIWADFVGTRIGALHALFIISQIIALPSFIIFMCTRDCNFPEHDCRDYQVWVKELLIWFFATVTGMLGIENAANR